MNAAVKTVPNSNEAPLAPLARAGLASEITELAAHINAATYRFLKLIAEFDRRGGWSGEGVKSCAHWLNWKCGIGLCAGREKIRVGRALEVLPQISEAFGSGVVSYSKVRAMTRIATPDNEDFLLHVAKSGTASHVEKVVRYHSRVERSRETEEANEQYASRELTVRWEEDGTLVVRGRLTPEQGALFVKALDAAAAGLDDSAVSSGARVNWKTRRADALGVMAETLLASGPQAVNGGDRLQVVVHVDAATLVGEEDSATEIHAIEDGPSLAGETIRRLCCDSGLLPIVVDDEGEPLNVGRRTRSVSAPLRRALKVRDEGCRFPGCTSTRFVDAHHITHWAHGGETKLSNLLLLCRFHHRQVHEGGFGVRAEEEGRGFVFTRPDGQVLARGPALAVAPDGDEHIRAANDDAGLDIDAQTGVTRWYGEALDYSIALGVLAARRRDCEEARSQRGPGEPHDDR